MTTERVTFPIPDLNRLTTGGEPFQFFNREEVGCISIDDMSNVYIDSKSEQKELKSYRDLREIVGKDLLEDIDNFRHVPYRHKPETLYKWIDTKGLNFLKKGNIDFVTSRGALRDISITPYDRFNQLKLYIRKDNGIIYINTIPDKREESAESAKIGQYKGTHFEYMATYDNGNPHPMSNENRYLAVCKTSLGSKQSSKRFQILFSGEIDSIIPHQNPGYAQTKTHNLAKRHGGFKVMSWWIQAHIIGLNQIVVGAYETQTSRIKSVKTYDIEDSEKFKRALLGYNYQRVGPKWKPGDCFEFCFNVLEFIAKEIKDDPKTVYKLTQEDRNLVLEKLAEGEASAIVVPLPTKMEGVEEVLPKEEDISTISTGMENFKLL